MQWWQATIVKRLERKTRPVEVIKWAEECDQVFVEGHQDHRKDDHLEDHHHEDH